MTYNVFCFQSIDWIDFAHVQRPRQRPPRHYCGIDISKPVRQGQGMAMAPFSDMVSRHTYHIRVTSCYICVTYVLHTCYICVACVLKTCYMFVGFYVSQHVAVSLGMAKDVCLKRKGTRTATKPTLATRSRFLGRINPTHSEPSESAAQGPVFRPTRTAAHAYGTCTHFCQIGCRTASCSVSLCLCWLPVWSTRQAQCI